MEDRTEPTFAHGWRSVTGCSVVHSCISMASPALAVATHACTVHAQATWHQLSLLDGEVKL